MSIAITAASGQLGQAIINHALPVWGRDRIVGLARTPSKATDLGIEIRPGDYRQPDSLKQSLTGIEILVLISAMDEPEERIMLHRHVIRAAQAAGVRKIIYTSIFGQPGRCGFDPIIQSNRQTEQDIRASGLEWIIGRNGLYIDADLEAISDYQKSGRISNCAGSGKCGYTSRSELADAYVNFIRQDQLNGNIYNLWGPVITQQELVAAINRVYGFNLVYQAISVDEYRQDRIKVHGPHLGAIIAGIYEGIRAGAFDYPGEYAMAANKQHLSLQEMVEQAQ